MSEVNITCHNHYHMVANIVIYLIVLLTMEEEVIHVLPRGGGGGTWVFRGVHTFVIKIKKYP